MHIPEPAASVLRDVRVRLEQLYGPRLRDVVLYGSYARGDAHAESDIDLLVVLDGAHVEAERSHIAEVANDLSLQHDVVLTFIVMGVQEYTERVSALLLNVRREGVSV